MAGFFSLNSIQFVSFRGCLTLRFGGIFLIGDGVFPVSRIRKAGIAGILHIAIAYIVSYAGTHTNHHKKRNSRYQE